MEKTRKAKSRMFAAVQIVCDREDLEDSEIKIVGVYPTKKRAQEELDRAKARFLKEIDDEDPENAEYVLENDCDRLYDWRVDKVSVELPGDRP